MNHIKLNRPLQININAASSHNLSPLAALICELIYVLRGEKITHTDIANTLGLSESQAKNYIKEAHALRFIEYHVEEGYNVTATYIQAFVYGMQEVETKVELCAAAFAKARHVYGQGTGKPTGTDRKNIAKVLKNWPKLQPGAFAAVVHWAAEVKYSIPNERDDKKKQQKLGWLKSDTLLKKTAVEGNFESAIQWMEKRNLFQNK